MKVVRRILWVVETVGVTFAVMAAWIAGLDWLVTAIEDKGGDIDYVIGYIVVSLAIVGPLIRLIKGDAIFLNGKNEGGNHGTD
ncbi:hypothetical protein LCGC14_1362680 [marine sediment metagenome]|uniref:Uncharacterized protein n=1 Tax=marine sediment metagenome TaxID=412755 RepID=A0A0F9KTN9_9ZZZZ